MGVFSTERCRRPPAKRERRCWFALHSADDQSSSPFSAPAIAATSLESVRRGNAIQCLVCELCPVRSPRWRGGVLPSGNPFYCPVCELCPVQSTLQRNARNERIPVFEPLPLAGGVWGGLFPPATHPPVYSQAEPPTSDPSRKREGDLDGFQLSDSNR